MIFVYRKLWLRVNFVSLFRSSCCKLLVKVFLKVCFYMNFFFLKGIYGLRRKRSCCRKLREWESFGSHGIRVSLSCSIGIYNCCICILRLRKIYRRSQVRFFGFPQKPEKVSSYFIVARFFKPSTRKLERSLEFAPTNLHLQRMWVQNDSLKKCGFYDVITVGAFTAHAHKTKNGGLIK